ncbi:MAG: WhiB family transcriptional regulator [Actinomycetota bacterium]
MTCIEVHAEDDWKLVAKCRGKTHLFYDGKRESEGQRTRREELAKKYCAVCPVAEICKIMGRVGREHGIWGGETDEERAAAGYLPTRSTSRRIRAAWRPDQAGSEDVSHGAA